MDGFSGCGRGWPLNRSLEPALSLIALRPTLMEPVPDSQHRDQGWPSAWSDSPDLLSASEVQIRMAAVGKPDAHGCAERLMRTLKEATVALSDADDFQAAYRSSRRFRDEVFSRKRLPAALLNLRLTGKPSNQNRC
jgi:transposase InsO family protein